MKKIVSLLLALIILVVPFETFATEFTSDGEGQIEFTAHEHSTYIVSIPERIEIIEDNQQIPITISEGNFEEGCHLVVYATNITDGMLELQHKTESEYKKQVLICNIQNDANNPTPVDESTPLLAYYPVPSGISENNMTCYFGLKYTENYIAGRAGDYSGTMTYNFSCIYDNYY